MGKGGKARKFTNKSAKKRLHVQKQNDDDSMDDEIDAFHKQRDVIPLDINDDVGESDEDNEQPVFDFKNDDDEDDRDDKDDTDDDRLAAKSKIFKLHLLDCIVCIFGSVLGSCYEYVVAKTQKHLRAKSGGVEDEMHDDAENDEDKRTVWGRRKGEYYGAPNVDFEIQSSDEELLEEEAEVLRLQKEQAKLYSMEDYGLEDESQEESDEEPTLEEIVKGKATSKASTVKEALDDAGTAFEEVKKDLNALSKEEQMDVVYSASTVPENVTGEIRSFSRVNCCLRHQRRRAFNCKVEMIGSNYCHYDSSAPELVGLLSELNDAVEELENKVNPLLSKLGEGHGAVKGRMHYMELKRLVLLSYCQSITFYLLLKSEGQPVRDHPVISRLVEIKNLLDKMKELDGNLPFELEEILNKQHDVETVVNAVTKDAAFGASSFTDSKSPLVVAATQEAPREAAKLLDVIPSKDNGNAGGKRKHQVDQVGMHSMEMLKVRAALEEKLKQKGVFTSIAPKHDGAKRNLQPVNGQLETLDDFDDEAVELEEAHGGMSNGHANSVRLRKLSHLVTPQLNKPKVISGDDDLPKRDDIGERRRKHELRVLTGAGINSDGDVEDDPGTVDGDGVADMEGDSENESDLDFYKQVEQQHAAKRAAKSEMYLRTPAPPSLPDALADGKRQISYQMEKNRGLTRARKKLTKNPRKKYKLKHAKAMVRRKGQVRDVKKPSGPYGGEASGINAGISRSIRFKS
ncbi:hypothetical protein RJ639_020289 [Escallonia herrerae]|uniref:Sas10 C-terminal domain-containing protein n=1 Tax=Escallonia herrerae TaxID=1293975 RepID=A0AA88V4N0_9ASTE|nr:hypothetical protein RJ639_020289 [Escallonia herrerae]